MPPFKWPVSKSKNLDDFNRRYNSSGAGGLLSWAVDVVDSLYYIADLDAAYDSNRKTLDGHRPKTIDVAHARWATSTAKTALDLCAAALGRAFCNHLGPIEFDIGKFDAVASRQAQRFRVQLPLPALHWIDGVLADPRYAQLKAARDALTHRRLPRVVYLSTRKDSPPKRHGLKINNSKVYIPELVTEIRDLSAAHVSELVQLLPNL